MEEKCLKLKKKTKTKIKSPKFCNQMALNISADEAYF